MLGPTTRQRHLPQEPGKFYRGNEGVKDHPPGSSFRHDSRLSPRKTILLRGVMTLHHFGRISGGLCASYTPERRVEGSLDAVRIPLVRPKSAGLTKGLAPPQPWQTTASGLAPGIGVRGNWWHQRIIWLQQGTPIAVRRVRTAFKDRICASRPIQLSRSHRARAALTIAPCWRGEEHRREVPKADLGLGGWYEVRHLQEGRRSV